MADDTTAHPTLHLIRSAQAGDAKALEQLYVRYLPRLKWWAKGRLPLYARGTVDTEDLVQEALTGTIRRVEFLDAKNPHCFQAYTRQAILNGIRMRLRRARPPRVEAEVLEHLPDPKQSPLEQVIGADALTRYESAMARLPPEDQELVIARLEMHYSWSEIAEIAGKSSPDAARVATKRVLIRLAEEMNP